MLAKKQAIYRLSKGNISPFQLNQSKQNLDLIQQMIELMEESIGEKHQNIEQSLQYLAGQLWQPKTTQAIVKLFLDKGDFEDKEINEAMNLRNDIFNVSSNYWNNLSRLPKLESIAAHILEKIPCPPKNDEDWLYKDLPANQKLKWFEPMSAENFIAWFNLCMVRSILLQATKMEISFFSAAQENLRQFMQYLKFFGLLFLVEKKENGWILIVDGPESILDSTRSYGIDFSNLFPALLLIEGEWTMEAEICIQGKFQNYSLKISNSDGYKSHYNKKNFWRKKEMGELIENWNTKYGAKSTASKSTDKSIAKASLSSDIFSLPDNLYLLPDFSIQKNGQTYYFEWLRYPKNQIANIKKKQMHLPENYFFLVIGSKKKLLNYFAHLFEKELIVCFAKEFVLSKIKEFLEKK